MKNLVLIVVFFLTLTAVQSQPVSGQEALPRSLFPGSTNADILPGKWDVIITEEYYFFDTLYDVIQMPEPIQVVVQKKDNRYVGHQINGHEINIEFMTTDVKSVYLFKNYFHETESYSKVQAVICKSEEMQYSYEVPYEIAKLKDESWQEDKKLVKIFTWTKATN